MIHKKYNEVSFGELSSLSSNNTSSNKPTRFEEILEDNDLINLSRLEENLDLCWIIKFKSKNDLYLKNNKYLLLIDTFNGYFFVPTEGIYLYEKELKYRIIENYFFKILLDIRIELQDLISKYKNTKNIEIISETKERINQYINNIDNHNLFDYIFFPIVKKSEKDEFVSKKTILKINLEEFLMDNFLEKDKVEKVRKKFSLFIKKNNKKLFDLLISIFFNHNTNLTKEIKKGNKLIFNEFNKIYFNSISLILKEINTFNGYVLLASAV